MSFSQLSHDSNQSTDMPRILAVVAPLSAAIIYIIAAVGRGIADSDEAIYVNAAQQMVQSGDWITPYVNGLRYLNKPPLLIWLVAASFKLFGVSEMAARLPGLAAIVTTTWLVQRITVRVAGQYAALCSGLAFAFCIGTAIFTLEVMTDIFLVFFLALAMYCFLLASENSFQSLPPVLIFFAAVGGAVMTKSLLGIAFPFGAAILYFLISRHFPRIPLKNIGLGCLLTGLITIPWHVVAEMRNPGFLENVIVNHQVLRFLGKMPGGNYMSVPLGLFWFLLLVWLFPWTLFLHAVIRYVRFSVQDDRLRKTRILCLSWAAVVLAVLTFSSRLEHYAFPLLPPLAILTGLTLASNQRAVNRWVRGGFTAMAVVAALLLIIGVVIYSGLLGAIGVPTLGWEMPAEQELTDYSLVLDLPTEILAQLLGWPLMVTIFGLSAGFFLAWYMHRSGRRVLAVLSIAAAMAVFVLSASRSLEICEPVLSSKAFGEAIARQSQPGDSAVILGDFWTARSIAFYAPIRLYIHGGSASAFQVAQQFPDAPKLKLTRDEIMELWQSNQGVFVIGEPEKVKNLDLPNWTTVMHSGGRVLVSNRLQPLNQ
jgi:4-amino-4-deoxy-L-arabinose transferase-like glycosyltransferase